MTLILSGTDGLSDVDGSAATPAIRGTDANTGIFFPAADTIAFSEGGVESMRIDSSGNVGIGTSSPSYPLDVVGATNSIYTRLGSSGRGLVFSQFQTSSVDNAGHLINASSGVGVLAFATNSTERMRIDTSGNLLVGGTLNTAGSGICCNTDNGISIERSGAGYRQMYISSSVLYFYNGTNQASLTSAGAWTNASDARLKNSIVDIKYGLTAVMNTQPRSYKMNDLDGEYVGFVAQELQQIIPEVVSGDPEKQLGVDYGSLVAVAFKAIQEQQAIITQLQADVAALKGTA